MSDRRYGREPEERPTSISLHEMVDAAVRRISTSIVIAGGIVAIAVYAGGGTRVEAPEYQVTAADGRVYRVSTESGRVIACQGDVCAEVLRRGQSLEDELPEDEPPARLPAPAATPAQAPAQAPAAAPAPAAPAPK